MNVINSHSNLSSSLTIKNSIFSNISASTNGGAMFCSSSTVSCLIKECVFVFCCTSANEGGALHFNAGKKYEVKCTNFRKNKAGYSPNFYISNRQTPFITKLENLAACNCQSSNSYPIHLDIYGGNPLLHKHVNCSDNAVTGFGFVIDYFVANRHYQFAFVNVANNRLSESYFCHDQTSMPTDLIYDKINFISNTGTNFFSINCPEKNDKFYDTNFLQTTQAPVFNQPVTFYNSYFCFSISNEQSVTIISVVAFEINIVVKENCKFKCTLKRSCKRSSGVSIFLINVLLFS